MQDRFKEQSTVFVVDDDADVRDALQALFQSVDLHSRAFGSSSEFLQATRPGGPCCLVLDIRLPETSGLDLQTELAKAEKNIPIVFITAHGDIPMAVKAIRAGAIDFLAKPFREQDLLDAVRLALDHSRARRLADEKLGNIEQGYNSLTRREQEVMGLVCAGLMNKQIASHIGVTEITVKVHRHNIMKKIGARSLPELVRMEILLQSTLLNAPGNNRPRRKRGALRSLATPASRLAGGRAS